MNAVKMNTKKIRATSRTADVIIIAVMGIVALFCLLPILNVLALSFSSSAAAAAGKVKFLPVGFTLNAYEYALTKAQFIRSFGISVKRVVLGLGVNMLFTVLAAYPLSKNSRQLTGRMAYAWFFFFTMIFSGGLIPWYTVIRQTGLMDTIWGVIIPGAVPVYNVIVLLNFFRQLPKELNEAAYVDGAGEARILFNIYLPLSLPSLATLTLFVAVGHWNSWFDGLILMKPPDNYPLQTYLRNQVVVMDQTTIMGMTSSQLEELGKVSDRTLRAAQIFIGALPVLAVYPFVQKYFMKGLVMGSVKG